ncbi:haze protective factor 1 isoform X2 [Puntigrus tetrazona]|uniref:haze protective factor 1 isoform X2 n=1 Tax=Puntigrus tetrazona TaxID=1606681 RepID=UPI001C8940F0|nr:haze protective factor 1 isoform X2 [Puntigrus tetrazona]
MALGGICCTIDISKNQRSLKTGFLFFLLLQMSLLSKVRTDTTASPANTQTTAVSSSSSQTGSSVSVSLFSAATSGSSVTGTSSVTSINSNATVSSAVNASSSDNALSCPAFVCTKDCYEQFMNATAKPCLSGQYACEIMKGDAGYSVSCSASCGVSCGNGTLANCSVNCCNTTNCLNSTLLGMFNSVSTTATTKTTTTTTTMKTTLPTTPASNGKKCHNIKCNGAACYKTYNVASSVVSCIVGQDYCMLQKTTSGSTESWQAGCSTDCRKSTACSSTTTTGCLLECCNATTSSSCLKLTGDVNMPSSAPGGPRCPALLTASLLLFWIARVFT